MSFVHCPSRFAHCYEAHNILVGIALVKFIQFQKIFDYSAQLGGQNNPFGLEDKSEPF